MIILYFSIFLLLEIPIFSRNRGNKHNTKKEDTINRAASGNYVVYLSQGGTTNINSRDNQEGDINIGNSLSRASDVNIKTGTTGEVNIKSNTINIIGNTDTSIFNIKNNNAIPVNVFSVASETGNTIVGGTLGVTGATTLSSTLGVTENTTLAGLTAGATTLGNTTVGGTLGVTGDFAVNTNKFTVDSTSGNTAVAGTITAGSLGTGTGTVLVLEAGTNKIIPQSSSRRYKENIQTIEDISEDNLDSLDVVEFNYKQQENKKCIGLIAEDLVGTPFEFAVFYNAEGLPESIDYQSIFVYLLGCYKKTTYEFKEILKNHTDEIQVLKEQNEIFKQMLNI